jgi:lactoylglutathione lyase
MPQLEVTGFGHVGIRVHDLERSVAFYELLGFKKIVGPVGPEPVAILVHPSGIEINLILNAADADVANPLMDSEEKLPGYTHMALVVKDLEQAAEVLEASGFPVSGRLEVPSGLRAIFVRDPDRNVVELDHLPEGFDLEVGAKALEGF